MILINNQVVDHIEIHNVKEYYSILNFDNHHEIIGNISFNNNNEMRDYLDSIREFLDRWVINKHE